MNELKDKLPPQATEVEKVVLGAMMLEKDAISRVSDLLSPEAFYDSSNRMVYEAIMQLYGHGKSVDMITVSQQMKKSGTLQNVGGPFYLTELTDRVSSAESIEQHSLILQQCAYRRAMITICSSSNAIAYDESADVFEFMEKHQSQVFGITQHIHGRKFSSIGELASERMKEYQVKPLNGLTGIETGLESINRVTNGWQNGHLIILAARPGMGKTAFALNMARNAAVKHDVPVAIFSLEMNKQELTDRMISAESGVFLSKILTRDLNETDWRHLIEANKAIFKAPVYIDDTPGLSIQSMRSKAIRMKETKKIGMVVVDYLQLMEGMKENRNANREQTISAISRGLKLMAKELNVPVIALSQLSREVEKRPNKRPQLSDLRDSGSIEQDADQVIFLYRPEYYGIDQDEEDGSSTVGVCEVIFGKNRNGVQDTVKTDFNGAKMIFRDLNGEPVMAGIYDEPTSAHNFSMPHSDVF